MTTHTTHIICSTICHKYCCTADDEDKSSCDFSTNNYFIRCKNKCHWSQHKNRPYYYEDYMTKETIT